VSELDLVTGGSGYFGSLLRDRLRERGRRVRVFDLQDAADRPPDVEFVAGDIRDLAAVERACAGVRVVHHNVAMVPLAKDRRAFWEVNRDGVGNLLAACRTAGVRKIVHTSSSAVFGVPAALPVTEDTEPRPVEDYGRAKLAGERLALEQAALHGQDVSVIRPRTILGHGRLGIFQILFDWVREGRAVPVLGRGDNRYQFVHADDLAEACIRAAERPGTRLYHVGAERFGTMRELLEALCRHAGTGSRVRSLPMGLAVAGMRATAALGLSPLAPYHWIMYGRSLWFDVSRARDELGFAARWSNEEMICQSYDWYLAHREELAREPGGSIHRSGLAPGILDWVKRVF
jgi:nucleoside-diphosphate-sugar epimerase